jgi:2-oxoglutarate dehydrogenase E1 component
MAQSGDMQISYASSYLSNGSTYIEELYESFLMDPQSVSMEWQQFFNSLPATHVAPDQPHAPIRDYFQQLAKQPMRAAPAVTADSMVTAALLARYKEEAAVQNLVNAYRTHGHHHSQLDPLKLAHRRKIADLSLEYHGLSQAQANTSYVTNLVGYENATLQDIHARLQQVYCGNIGVEFKHISSTEETTWLQQQLEATVGRYKYSAQQQQQFLQRLTAAEGLEKYLGTKFVGQKRFSLEGGDSLIPLLDAIIQAASQRQTKELVIGMAHRGRLNVLVNILGKAPEDLFKEFEGKKVAADGRSGDVKYHQGFSSDLKMTDDKNVHLVLAFNPSHLEIISPVVEGSVRARLHRRGDQTFEQVLAISIHGDAAFAGQGVVMETFNMSQARGFTTGGTVHIVINNQIGFTTSNPIDARSTLYCTDVAKMVQAPVFHVNADDVEAVVFISQLAFAYRELFKKDVLIDLVCYRRHGHNEADEPSATQPLMYAAIKVQPTVRQLYADELVKRAVITQEQATQMVEAYRDHLDAGQLVVANINTGYVDPMAIDWAPYQGQEWNLAANTSVKLARLQELGRQLLELPAGFVLQAQVQKLMQDRQKMTAGEIPMNWGYAETMAYATLLDQGVPIRFSGQDCGRGTFSHRHAVLHDQKTDNIHTPLAHLSPTQPSFLIIDSILSEEAVLAFEYGYASAMPESLVIWEAQFGDFANGAQVVIDQFISSGEQKWGRLCGLVMLLPHGFEGQGPEHSSARLERYLQLCAQHNMQVCVPTTPAQMFHMLRRQALRPYRKPLVVMTPKSLLRHPLAVSTLSELTDGQFYPVIGDQNSTNASAVTRVILTSGKVYYDLLEARRTAQRTDVAIIRIEQLYPFPEAQLQVEMAKYKTAPTVVWCQEEPKNQGAWYSTGHHLAACLQPGQTLFYAGRDAAASPAAGAASLHAAEQAALVKQAIG